MPIRSQEFSPTTSRRNRAASAAVNNMRENSRAVVSDTGRFAMARNPV